MALAHGETFGITWGSLQQHNHCSLRMYLSRRYLDFKGLRQEHLHLLLPSHDRHIKHLVPEFNQYLSAA